MLIAHCLIGANVRTAGNKGSEDPLAVAERTPRNKRSQFGSEPVEFRAVDIEREITTSRLKRWYSECSEHPRNTVTLKPLAFVAAKPPISKPTSPD